MLKDYSEKKPFQTSKTPKRRKFRAERWIKKKIGIFKSVNWILFEEEKDKSPD